MKRPFILLIALCMGIAATAQPPKRRSQATEKSRSTTTQNAPQGVSYREFPTAQAMPADAAWRRDVYRELDLAKDENATLYYPTMPQDGRMNLFSYIFKLLLRKQLTAYDTKLDAVEDFSAGNTITAKALMDRYHMFYEEKDGRLRVNDADIPSDEVKMYYVKESVYYDQYTSTFHTRVTALCPVLLRGDMDFGGTEARYPMFWIKYDDIAPQLGKLMLMSSNYNNAASISADDYFTMARYKGDIFRTVNMQDRLLANYCPTDSDMTRERQRIEGELTEFRDHVWGKDSTATAATTAPATPAAAQPAEETTADKDAPVEETTPKRSVRRGSAGRRTTAKTTSAKKAKAAKAPRSSSSRSVGFSVRRERH